MTLGFPLICHTWVLGNQIIFSHFKTKIAAVTPRLMKNENKCCPNDKLANLPQVNK